MVKKFLLYIILITSILSGCAQVGKQNPAQPSKNERIDELFTYYTDSGEFSGAVLIAQNDQILLRKGYGFANREEQILYTPEMLFHIQSIGKIFTYASVLIEEKEG